MTRLRVLSLNILRGGRRGAPLIELVRAVAPDVLLVNETPKTPGTSRRDCRRLTEAWGMRMVTGGRTAGSNLIAVADHVEVIAAASEVIAPARFGSRFQPRRGIASARLRVRGEPVGVVSTHLSLTPTRRADEIERVVAIADRLPEPVVVGGDLNEAPDGPSWRRLRRAGYVDHGSGSWKTFPSQAPEARIDAVLVRGAATVLAHGDPGVPTELQVAASDHRGVLATLELGEDDLS